MKRFLEKMLPNKKKRALVMLGKSHNFCPVVLMSDGTIRKGSNAEIIGVYRLTQTIKPERVKVDEETRTAVMKRDNFTCQECGHVFEYVERGGLAFPLQTLDAKGKHLCLEIDHIIPVRFGGSNDPLNLQVLCTRCNSRKGASLNVWQAT